VRTALGDVALEIHHIGSTAIPGIAAKDVIDVQVTVADLDVIDRFRSILEAEGFGLRTDINRDHLPPGSSDPEEWVKRYAAEVPGDRPVHVHFRRAGSPNRRYAILFRDYLRAEPSALERYEDEKRRLAVVHNFDSTPYAIAKDVVCDELMLLAEEWAARTGWSIPPGDE
jgi:GrpB-like predicted nucleotidyltransferase (UPF0157 family)